MKWSKWNDDDWPTQEEVEGVQQGEEDVMLGRLFDHEDAKAELLGEDE